MEGLGDKFQKARQARNLTLEEAARMTKIRPAKLAELEAEDFSHFPSLAYAKGFLVIYGKFLNVDVTPYLEAFEAPETMTVDGYSYLQDNPVPAPRRTEVVRREPRSGNRSSLTPLVIGVVVLVGGFLLLKFMMDLRRLKPSERDAQALAASSASPTPAASETIVAPKALPVDPTPAPARAALAVATPIPLPSASATPEQTPIAALPLTEGEPEVRRAEPVRADEVNKATPPPVAASTPAPTPSPTATVAPMPTAAPVAAISPSISPTPAAKIFDIRPLKKTFVRVTLDTDRGRSSFQRWVDVNTPLQLRGKSIAVKSLDRADLVIRKNGKIVSGGDADVRVE